MTSNQYVGAKRYKLTSGHSDDAGLGGEGYMVRMSDHYPSFDIAQKWVKSEDYEALRQRFEKACQRVTELESAVETTAPFQVQRIEHLKTYLTPVEWEHLKDWHKNAAQLCAQVDDFGGARMHREGFREMDERDKRPRGGAVKTSTEPGT